MPPHELPDLPFEYDALEGISEDVGRFHRDRHHAGYVDGRNRAEERLERARSRDDWSKVHNTREDKSLHPTSLGTTWTGSCSPRSPAAAPSPG
jgi:Fe-Mn family superoxide dismutase